MRFVLGQRLQACRQVPRWMTHAPKGRNHPTAGPVAPDGRPIKTPDRIGRAEATALIHPLPKPETIGLKPYPDTNLLRFAPLLHLDVSQLSVSGQRLQACRNRAAV
jgi:hypothetical protein